MCFIIVYQTIAVGPFDVIKTTPIWKGPSVDRFPNMMHHDLPELFQCRRSHSKVHI